jgi:hypothetical protein
MKKTLLTALLIAGAASAFGQGAINYGNATGFRAPVYGPDPGNGSLSTTGQSALGTPTGSTVYNGPLLQGTGFTFALFGGPLNTPSNTMFLLASTTFRTATANALPAGLTLTGSATVPGATANQSASYQVRVWNNQGGTITTWGQQKLLGSQV